MEGLGEEELEDADAAAVTRAPALPAADGLAEGGDAVEDVGRQAEGLERGRGAGAVDRGGAGALGAELAEEALLSATIASALGL